MNFSRHPRHTARIARAMLVVWVFALVSGFANACLLQDPAAVRHAAHEVLEDAALPHGHAGHEHPADPDGDGARQLCQSVCDDEQTTLTKVTTPSVPDLGPALLSPIEPWSFCAVEAQFPRGCPPGAAPPPERPVAIRFLRLTI